MSLTASREWRRSHFRLERISARGRMVGSIFRAIVCGLLGVAMFFVTSLVPAATEPNSRVGAAATGTFVQPTSLPTARFTPTVVFAAAAGVTPVIGIPSIVTKPNANGIVVVNIITTTLIAPTSTGIVATALPPTQAIVLLPVEAAVVILPSPTVRPSPLPLPPPPPPIVPVVPTPILANCANPRAQIFSITNEAGPRIYTMRGNAQIEQGGYYKLEMILGGQTQWSFLVRGSDSITANALLSAYNFSSFPAGNYPLRLVLVRLDGNIGAICETTLTLP